MKIKALSMAITFGLMASSTLVNAAHVPEGTQLAEKQELIRGNGTEVSSLDPQKIEGVPESNVAYDLFETLVTQDDLGNIVPGVASAWETEDNKTFLFHIRPDAKWSNGDAVTANDFVYTWRRLADPNTASPYGWYIEMTNMENAAAVIKGELPTDKLGVKALDDLTLEVKLDKPVPYFVLMTGHASMSPVNQKNIEEFGDAWTMPDNMVSNGAFKLNKRVVNERLEMVRNPYYWDNDHLVLDKVTFLPIENQVAEMNRFLSGEIDMTYEVPNEHVRRLKKEHADVFKVTPQLCSYYYAFNTTKAPFNDERIRKALSYAIDRDVITKFILGKGDTPAYNFAHKEVAGLKFEQPEYASWTQKERDTKAMALMNDAGFNKSNPLEFTLLYNTSENHKKIAVAIAAMYKKLGVKVNLENQEWKTYLDNRSQGNFDVIRAGWCGDYNEASTFLSLLQSNNDSNDSKYNSAAYDAVMNEALVATDEQTRAEKYSQAESLLAKDMPITPIYHYMMARLVQDRVGGYPMHNAEDKIYSKDLYIKK